MWIDAHIQSGNPELVLGHDLLQLCPGQEYKSAQSRAAFSVFSGVTFLASRCRLSGGSQWQAATVRLLFSPRADAGA